MGACCSQIQEQDVKPLIKVQQEDQDDADIVTVKLAPIEIQSRRFK